MVKYHLTNNPSQTKKLGEILAREILKTSFKKAAVVGLRGQLGSGKTTFLQGFAMGLGIKKKILSPTFILMRRFTIYRSRYANFYHIDCYRIENTKEILNLGLKEIISAPQNIVAIEWAEKIKKFLPRDTFWINLEFVDKNIRKFIIKAK